VLRIATISFALAVGATACAGGSAAPIASRTLPIVHASESKDGHTLTLRKGQRLQVVLHSTYWQFKKSSDPAVLREVGKPVVRPKTAGCVAGQGCGTVTVVFVGVAAGSANVAASRNSCGEAMGCTAAAGAYALHVVVR
jgi:hypothetical protein